MCRQHHFYRKIISGTNSIHIFIHIMLLLHWVLMPSMFCEKHFALPWWNVQINLPRLAKRSKLCRSVRDEMNASLVHCHFVFYPVCIMKEPKHAKPTIKLTHPPADGEGWPVGSNKKQIIKLSHNLNKNMKLPQQSVFMNTYTLCRWLLVHGRSACADSSTCCPPSAQALLSQVLLPRPSLLLALIWWEDSGASRE